MSEPSVHLRPRKARPFFARHPWVLEGSIDRIEGSVAAGDEVRLLSHEGVLVARGLYNPASRIRVRLYRWEDEALDAAFWRSRLEAAITLRRDVLGLVESGSACRLVFSESDGLSGLTVDRYDRWLVAQFTSLALFQRQGLILELLRELVEPDGLVVRTEAGMASLEGLRLTPEDQAPRGSWPEGPVRIEEHGLSYEVEPRGGQKTGFYLDQRANRRAVARYAAGRRVLDLYCYTGGFGLTAARHGGALAVLGIDSSAPAIERAALNAQRNGLADQVRFMHADALDTVRTLHAQGERFGLVVCDPPKFARSAGTVDEAIKGYTRVNRAILDVLEPGGVLVTCSCSGHVDRLAFAQMLAYVAGQAGRPIQILEQRGQAPDHPVASWCLETDYLKCFICRVG